MGSSLVDRLLRSISLTVSVLAVTLLVTGCEEIVPDTAPSFSGTVGNQTYVVGTPIATLTLPAASGGDGTLTYSLQPDVPGLTFDATARTLSGTPTAPGTHSMTYTVVDDDDNTSDSDSATLRFSITVTAARPPDTAPSFSGTVGNQVYVVGTPIATLTLPAASGGDGTLTYSLQPDVPGLTFDATARTLSGTPTAPGTHSMTYTVVDDDDNTSDSDAATLRFSITVTAARPPDTSPSFGSNAVSDQRYVAGVPIPVLTLPQASGGDGTLTYSLQPDVPGLTFSADDRTLKGVPAAAGTHSMRYEARDEDGDTTSLSFRIEAEPLTAIYWIQLTGATAVVERSGLDGGNRATLLGKVSFPTIVKVAEEHMYWIELELGAGFKSKIRRANRDGSSPEDLVTGLGIAVDLAIDDAGGKLYWTELDVEVVARTSGTAKLRQSDLDGEGVRDLVTLQDSAIVSIAVDTDGGKIYWTEADQSGTGRIRRADLDGAHAEDVVTDQELVPYLSGIPGPGLALAGGQIYFSTGSRANVIARVNVDGSEFEPLVRMADDRSAFNLALDAAARKIYWTEAIQAGVMAKIRRANLDGTGTEDYMTSGNDWLIGIALDAADRKIVWTETQHFARARSGEEVTSTIRRANPDGSDRQDLVTVTNVVITASAIAVDVLDRKMYFAGAAGGEEQTTITIQRAGLDGSGMEVVHTASSPDQVLLGGMALDVSGRKLYWAEERWDGARTTSTIWRASLDGKDSRNLLTVDRDVEALAVDAVGGRMYWTDGKTILSANLDGTGRKDLEVEATGAQALAVDAVRRQIYWSYRHAAGDGGGIRRADLDGTGQRDLAVAAAETAPRQLAIDSAGRKLYWADWNDLRSTNLEGTGQKTVVAGVYVSGIALGIR